MRYLKCTILFTLFSCCSQNDKYFETTALLNEYKNNYDLVLINDAIANDSLCKKSPIQDLGNAYFFNCKDPLNNRFVIIEKYDKVQIEEFLYYEQFVDYANKPKKIKKNWFVITYQNPY